jgi:hypothetical protein
LNARNVQVVKVAEEGVTGVFGVRVKGIYSTALTELLVENGVTVVDASPQLKARFGDSVSSRGVALATIKDREDRRGVVILGRKDVVERITTIFRNALQLSPIAVMPGELYATYVCRVVGERTVELPDGSIGLLEGEARVGELVPAHIVSFREGRPVLKKGVAVVGTYARLVEGQLHGVSEHIRGPQRTTLLSLAEKTGLEGWGVRWRSSARWAKLSELNAELQKLKGLAEKAREAARTLDHPAKITDGEILVFVPFALDDKRLLDHVRARRMATVPYHHLAKACGERFSALVDALEGFSERRTDEQLSNRVLEILESEVKGERLRIFHETPGGKVVEIEGAAEVASGKPLIVKLQRKISGKGVYDGLGLAKEEGDTAISVIVLGSYVLPHAYFSAAGELKGLYVNVNTPVEPCPPSAVWYVDAYVDVVWSREQGLRIVDLEELRDSRVFSNSAISKFEAIAQEVFRILKDNERILATEPLALLTDLTIKINFFASGGGARG